MREIIVYGSPAPQGSKAFKGMRGGKGIMVEVSKAVKPWREAVKYACLEHPGETIKGPVKLTVAFTMPRPQKPKSPVPDRMPDLSKLVRSTEDALTDMQAWEDDARIVECLSIKTYPGQHRFALDSPGARIIIQSIL